MVSLCVGLTLYAQMRYIDDNVAQLLRHEAKRLKQIHDTQPHQAFLEEIAELQSQSLDIERLFALAQRGQPVPERLRSSYPEGKVFNLWVDDRDIPGLVREESGYWPAMVVPLDDGCTLLISIHSEINEALRHQLLPTIVVLGVLLVITMLWLGASIGRIMLARVEVLNDTARAVTAGELSRRAPMDGSGDEFDELSSHFNTMLDKTEKLLLGMRRVSDNVAHDLRKPLSRLRSGLEVTLLETRTPEQYRQAMENAVLEADNVIATFNSLLQIARVESGAGPRELKLVDLGALATELAELYQSDNEPIITRTQEAVLTLGDPHLLRQALSNLLENALKFSKNHEIAIEVDKVENRSVVTVSDRGPGIPPDKREFVLERFSRLEDARSTPGNGLGLAMVKATAELHQAELTLEDNHPGLRVVLGFKSLG